MRLCLCAALTLIAVICVPPARADEDINRVLATIKAVSREGKGNEDAGPAWKILVSKGSAALMPTLEAFDDTNPTASNWLRTAVDAIVEGEKAAGQKLPADKLEAFATNPKFAASGRLVAFEVLTAQEPSLKAKLLPGFLNDKSPDLRREAIQYEITKYERDSKPGHFQNEKELFERLFAAARDKDQVELIAKKLADLGVKVSVSEHFAFLTHVSLVGPFDSADGKGFAKSYPPEKAHDTSESYTGKGAAKLTWKRAETTEKLGNFDLNKLLDKHKDSVAYALATVVAESETPCDIRVTHATAVQVFLNGKKVAEHEEYHHGLPLDGTVGKGVLKKGENVIVLKVCQNNQTEPWAQAWQFQLRVCDATGGPLTGVQQKVPEGGKLIKLGYIPESAVKPEEKK
jgi:hypothetical protein